MAGGRPKWEPTANDLIKIESMASRGLTKKEIAISLGICYDTLNERQKENTEFSDAIKRGQAKGNFNIANALFNNAKSGNVTAQIFYLKSRAGWSENDASKQNGEMTTDEFREMLKEMDDSVEDAPPESPDNNGGDDGDPANE